jgi:hypothetical protein
VLTKCKRSVKAAVARALHEGAYRSTWPGPKPLLNLQQGVVAATELAFLDFYMNYLSRSRGGKNTRTYERKLLEQVRAFLKSDATPFPRHWRHEEEQEFRKQLRKEIAGAKPLMRGPVAAPRLARRTVAVLWNKSPSWVRDQVNAATRERL